MKPIQRPTPVPSIAPMPTAKPRARQLPGHTPAPAYEHFWSTEGCCGSCTVDTVAIGAGWSTVRMDKEQQHCPSLACFSSWRHVISADTRTRQAAMT